MRANMDVVKNSPKRDGLFFVSCFDHCGNFDPTTLTVNGVTYAEALGKFLRVCVLFPAA